ncbi:MAG: hypothetical protein AAF585_28435, partial [Verrucomicrobiota bacterium]
MTGSSVGDSSLRKFGTWALNWPSPVYEACAGNLELVWRTWTGRSELGSSKSATNYYLVKPEKLIDLEWKTPRSVGFRESVDRLQLPVESSNISPSDAKKRWRTKFQFKLRSERLSGCSALGQSSASMNRESEQFSVCNVRTKLELCFLADFAENVLMNSSGLHSVFAAIYIPNFRLQAQIRLRPQLQDHGRSAALLDEDGDIIERNDDAARFHVELGMSATHAQARCEGIELLYPNPDDEAEAQADLLTCAESFTADFESTANGVATLDLFSNPNRNHKRLGREIVDWLAGAKLPAQVGVAANPDLALLTAKLACLVEVVRGDREAIRKFLAPLPVDALNPPKETRDVLALWGVQTLGDFMMLPRHEITERLGREAGDLWDHASGTRRRLLRLERPSVNYSQATNLDYEIATLEPALFWIQRALEVISARLSANYLVAERLTLTLTYNDGGAYQR